MATKTKKAKCKGMVEETKGRRVQPPAVGPVLRKLSEGREPVRVEIDPAMARFNTGLLVKGATVLVGKPEGLEASMSTGDIARFKIPWKQEFEVRMEISVLHLNLSNGTEVFLCKTPSGLAYPARRGNDRFNTRGFTNIRLDLPALNSSFSILDLSAEGCRVDAEPGLVMNAFRVNRRLWEGKIVVGERLQVQLDLVIPRTYHNEAVGLEFKVSRGERHTRHLTTLLGTLALRGVRPQTIQPG